MKYKCSILVKDRGSYYAIWVDCFSWRYLFESFCLETLRGEGILEDYYKNMNINKIINQIKNKILEEHYKSNDDTEDIITKIQAKANKIIIEL